MNCEEFKDIVFELARGELTGEAAEKAARHMEECPVCREEYETVKSLAEALASLGEENAPQSLLPNVMNMVAAERAAKKPSKKLNIIRFGSIAAAAAVLVVGAVNVLPMLVDRHPSADVDEAGTQNEQTVVTEIAPEYTAGGSEAEESADAGEEKTAPAAETAQAPSSTAETSAANPDSGNSDGAADNVNDAYETNSKKSPSASGGKTSYQAKDEQVESRKGGGQPVQPPVQNTEAAAIEQSSAQPDSVAVPRVSGSAASDEAASTADETDENGGAAMTSLGPMRMVADEEDGAITEPEDTAVEIAGIAEYGVGGFESDSSAHTGGGSGGGSGGVSGGSGGGSVGSGGSGGVIKLVCRRVTFNVAPEFAAVAAQVETEGRTSAQISAELDALGVISEVAVEYQDMTEEYQTASAERRAEILSLCRTEQCAVEVK